MKKDGIDWGYLMGRLLLKTASYEAPGPFALDENGCLADGFAEDEVAAQRFAPGQCYPLCGDWSPEELEEAEE